MNVLRTLFVFLLALPGIYAEPEISGTPTELKQHLSSLPEQVMISGKAERVVKADLAVVAVSVETSDREWKASLEKNTRIRAELVSALTEAGIDEARIHTSRFSSTPQHGSWSGKVKEYHIVSAIEIKAETEQEVQAIAGRVDSVEGVSLRSMNFELSEKAEVENALMDEALQRVQERKSMYEKALGVRLVPRDIQMPVTQITDGAVARARKGARYYDFNDSGSLASTSVMAPSGPPEPTPAISQFEDRIFNLRVVVTFDLIPEVERPQ